MESRFFDRAYRIRAAIKVDFRAGISCCFVECAVCHFSAS